MSLRRLASNFAWVLAGHLVEAGGGLLLVAIVARYLRPDRFGTYAFVLSFVQMFYFITDIGLVRLMVREISRDSAQAGRYLGAALISRVLLAAVTIPALLVTIHLVGASAEAVGAAYIATWWLLLRLFTSVYDGLFQAFERMEFGSGLASASMVLRLTGSVVVIAVDAGLAGVLWVMVGAQLLQLLGSVALAHAKFARPQFRREPAMWRFFLVESLPIGALGAFNTAFHEIDTLILAAFRTPAEVGFYNGPYRIVRQLLLLPLLLMRAPFPVISRLYQTSRPSLRTVSEQGLKLCLALSLPMGVGLALLAEPIVTLVLGADFLPGTFVLWFYSGILVVMFPTMFAATLLVAMDKQRAVAVSFGGCVGLNTVLDLVLIPPLGGLGACVATAITTLAMFGVLGFLVVRHLGRVATLRTLVQPALGAAGLGVFLYAFRGRGLLPSLLLGGPLYLLLMLLVGTFSRKDLRLLREAVKGA